MDVLRVLIQIEFSQGLRRSKKPRRAGGAGKDEKLEGLKIEEKKVPNYTAQGFSPHDQPSGMMLKYARLERNDPADQKGAVRQEKVCE